MMHEWEVASEYMSPESVPGWPAEPRAVHAARSDCICRLEPCLASQATQRCTSGALLEIAYHAAPKTLRGLAPSFTRPQRRSQSNLLHNGYGTFTPIDFLREGAVERTAVRHHRLAFTFTVRRTHIATSYCPPIPHLKTATAAFFFISRLQKEAAAPLSTLTSLPVVTLEFPQLSRPSTIFVVPELTLTASAAVFADFPRCSFGQSSETHSRSLLVSPLIHL